MKGKHQEMVFFCSSVIPVNLCNGIRWTTAGFHRCRLCGYWCFSCRDTALKYGHHKSSNIMLPTETLWASVAWHKLTAALLQFSLFTFHFHPICYEQWIPLRDSSSPHTAPLSVLGGPRFPGGSFLAPCNATHGLAGALPAADITTWRWNRESPHLTDGTPAS